MGRPADLAGSVGHRPGIALGTARPSWLACTVLLLWSLGGLSGTGLAQPEQQPDAGVAADLTRDAGFRDAALPPPQRAPNDPARREDAGVDPSAAATGDAGWTDAADVEAPTPDDARSAGAGSAKPAAAQPPRWLQPTAPPWPATAGAFAPVDVLVLVSLDEHGRVTDVAPAADAVRAPPAFVDAALAFVRQQQFAPALRAGVPAASRVKLLVRFVPPAVDAHTPHAGVPVDPVQGSAAGAPLSAPGSSVPRPVSSDPANAPAPSSAEYAAEAHIAGDAGEAEAATASDLRIEVGALHQVPRPDAMHLLTLSPGIVLTNHSGEGHAHNAFLRGFDAGEGQDLEVRVSGIPINEPSNAHGHGYADTAFLIPELVHQVHVLQGPFDARQGDFAAAGTAEFELAAPEPGIRAQVGYGSFARRRLLLAWSPSAADRGTFAGVDLEEGQGFGPNRAHAQVRGLGQFAGRFAHTDYRVLVASHALRFDAAGVVRQDAVEAESVHCGGTQAEPFFCFLDPNQGGHASRHLVSARLGARRPDRAWNQQFTLMLRESRFRANFTGALLDPRGDGLDQQTRATTFAVQGSYRLRAAVRERPQALELGYEGRYDTGESSSWRLRGDGQTPYASMFDHALALTRVSAYVLAELALQRWLTAQLGARADTFGYTVRDQDRQTRDLDGERLPQQAINAWGTNLQPRATLRVGPFAGLSWVSSFGIGSRSTDAAALSEGERAPFTRIWAGESGLVSEIDAGALSAETRASFYYAYVDRDLLFDETRGRNVPIGATNRYGAHAHLRLRAGDHADGIASFTWAEAYQPEDESPGFARGPRLPFVPRFVLRGDAAVSDAITLRKQPLQWGAGVGASWIGPRPLPLNTFSRAIFSLDASIRARIRFIEAALSVTNLTDRRNRSAEYFYPSDFGTGGPTLQRRRHFSAAPPRQFMATVAFVLDPGVLREEEP